MADKPAKRTYQRLEFSDETENEIIDFVKQHQELYNPKDKNYKNKIHRDGLWNEIGEKIGKTGTLKYTYFLKQ